MTTIKVNAITVPSGGEEVVRRFAARAGAVDHFDGFEGFELLAPTDDRNVFLVVTRWRDEASYQAWVGSEDFKGAHREFRPGAHGTAPVEGEQGPCSHAGDGAVGRAVDLRGRRPQQQRLIRYAYDSRDLSWYARDSRDLCRDGRGGSA